MDNRISAIQIAKNIGVSERTVQRYIKEMKDAGILNREGSDIDGSWQIW
jgi:DNA-binding Lrp family transcriptional regulator